MSTTTIIWAVSASLAVLVIVVFALQQIEKSNREKQALVAALKTRVRGFQLLLDGFPDGFLNSDLRALVCRCLLDAYEQLLKLEPRNPAYRSEQEQIADRLRQSKSEPLAGGYQPLTDSGQIQEVQRLLNTLYNVVQGLVRNKRLSGAEGTHYAQQISALTLRIALDGHLHQAQQAIAGGKPRLAVHYYRLASDKMRKNNANEVYSAQLQLCEQRIAELESAAERIPEDSAPPTDGQWQEFDEESEAWKKKSVYD